MKIAIMSDSHDAWDNLSKAIAIANEHKCKLLFFAGDLISPPGISILEQFKGKVIVIFGNNEGEKVTFTRVIDTSENITLTGDIFESTVDGVRFFMNHYPRISELAAASNQFDVCIHGHDHLYRHEVVDKTVLINPGEIQGYRTKNPHLSFIILDTKGVEIKKIEL